MCWLFCRKYLNKRNGGIRFNTKVSDGEPAWPFEGSREAWCQPCRS